MVIIQLIRLLQMLGLALLQILVMNHIHFQGYATPLIYVEFLFFMPQNISRTGALLWAFAMGLIIDIFSNTPGISCAAMTLCGMIQPPLLRLMAPKDSIEGLIPTYRTMGRWTHVRYIFLLLTLHHLAYFALESFSFPVARDLLISFAGSLALSLILILSFEGLRTIRS